jgi:1,6-anhydro-N-acetylmuramate kinase
MGADRYAGVMSGTSLDGVDAVVADFARDGNFPVDPIVGAWAGH